MEYSFAVASVSCCAGGQINADESLRSAHPGCLLFLRYGQSFHGLSPFALFAPLNRPLEESHLDVGSAPC